MSNWTIWWLMAGVLVAAELFTGTFYLLMIAIGFAAGGAVALFDIPVSGQLLIAAIVSIIAVVALRRSRLGDWHKRDAVRDPNINLDIGQSIQVALWHEQGDTYTARVKYRGADWDVDLIPGSAPVAGQFFIHEVRGSRLLVDRSPDA
ncbi:NfeD family protein [Herbaspirillum sp. RTI4]|nr:NfeD family protein [Herbaspirillum sp. RTI4]